MAITPNETYNEIEVCTDCMLTVETGETPANTDKEPWGLYPAGYDVTADWDSNETEDTGITEFSSTHCEGCGTTLAGARYRYADWL